MATIIRTMRARRGSRCPECSETIIASAKIAKLQGSDYFIHNECAQEIVRAEEQPEPTTEILRPATAFAAGEGPHDRNGTPIRIGSQVRHAETAGIAFRASSLTPAKFGGGWIISGERMSAAARDLIVEGETREEEVERLIDAGAKLMQDLHTIKPEEVEGWKQEVRDEEAAKGEPCDCPKHAEEQPAEEAPAFTRDDLIALDKIVSGVEAARSAHPRFIAAAREALQKLWRDQRGGK